MLNVCDWINHFILDNSSVLEEVGTEHNNKVAMEKYFTPALIFIIAGIGFVSVLVILLLFLLCHRIHKHRFGYNPTNTQEVSIDLNKLPSNVAYHR